MRGEPQRGEERRLLDAVGVVGADEQPLGEPAAQLDLQAVVLRPVVVHRRRCALLTGGFMTMKLRGRPAVQRVGAERRRVERASRSA